MGEITRWLAALEKRMGDMHGENRAGITEIKASVANLADLQRAQNSNVAKIQERASLLEFRTGVVEQQQRSTDEELDRIQSAAMQAATGAATQAIHDTAPGAKRATAISAAAAGVTGGGIFALAKVAELVFKAWSGSS